MRGANGRDTVYRVFVVESLDEARAIADHLEDSHLDPSRYVVVGLEAPSRAFLKRRGIASLDTVPFFDNAAHARALRKVGEIEERIHKDLALDFGDGLDTFYTASFVYYLSFYVRLMCKTIEILDGIRHAFPGDVGFACAGATSPHLGCSTFKDAELGYFLVPLCQTFCQVHGLPLEALLPGQEHEPSPPVSPSNGNRFGELVDRIIAQFYLATFGMPIMSRSALATSLLGRMGIVLGAIRAQFPDTKLLVLREGHYGRGEELARALYWWAITILRLDAGNRWHTIPIDLLKTSPGESGEPAAAQVTRRAVQDFLDQNRDLFVYRDIPFLGELRRKIDADLIPFLAAMHHTARVEARLLKHLRPALVLSTASVPKFGILGRLCQKHGIPAMIIPVKTLVEPKDELEAIGLTIVGREIISDDYAYCAVQMPQAQGYLDHIGYAGQAVRTGPLTRIRLGAAERQECRARFGKQTGTSGPVVLYAPTMKRIHPFHVIETIDEVLRSMKDVIAAIGELDGVRLILRPHPGSTFISWSDIEALVEMPQGLLVSASHRDSFPDTLAVADVLISNSSTTIEEALVNGVPVVLYDRYDRYNHLDALPVRRGVPAALSPAYYVAGKEHLAPTLRWVLQAHAANPLIPPEISARYLFQEELNHNFDEFLSRVLKQAGSPCPDTARSLPINSDSA